MEKNNNENKEKKPSILLYAVFILSIMGLLVGLLITLNNVLKFF